MKKKRLTHVLCVILFILLVVSTSSISGEKWKQKDFIDYWKKVRTAVVDRNCRRPICPDAMEPPPFTGSAILFQPNSSHVIGFDGYFHLPIGHRDRCLHPFDQIATGSPGDPFNINLDSCFGCLATRFADAQDQAIAVISGFHCGNHHIFGLDTTEAAERW